MILLCCATIFWPKAPGPVATNRTRICPDVYLKNIQFVQHKKCPELESEISVFFANVWNLAWNIVKKHLVVLPQKWLERVSMSFLEISGLVVANNIRKIRQRLVKFGPFFSKCSGQYYQFCCHNNGRKKTSRCLLKNIRSCCHKISLENAPISSGFKLLNVNGDLWLCGRPTSLSRHHCSYTPDFKPSLNATSIVEMLLSHVRNTHI